MYRVYDVAQRKFRVTTGCEALALEFQEAMWNRGKRTLRLIQGGRR